MFSRSVPPAHCVKGSDSMGKHVSRELMASSARRGVMSVLACMIQNGRRTDPPRRSSFTLFRFEDFQLLIELSDDGLQFVDRGIVFLHEDFLVLVGLFLLIGRHFRRVLG